jgi:hypothetical protein
MSLLPIQYRIAIIAFVLLTGLAGVFGDGHRQYTKGVTQGRAEVQAQFDAYKAQALQQAIAARDAAIKAQQAAADETARRLTDQQEASHVHEKQLNQARADAADAAGAVARLRQRIAQLTAAGSGGGGAASSNPAAAAVSTPASRVGDVAGQCVGALAQLRDVARRGQLAGDECAARYDALTVPK